jgi:hypothetical protein
LSGQNDCRGRENFGRCRSAALSQKAALQMLFTVTTPPVKMRLEHSAECDKREILNNLSAIDAQSNAERIPNRPTAGTKTFLFA